MDREQTDGCEEGVGVQGWVKKVRGLSKEKNPAQTQTTVW